jgi:large subunit ribosomal protein L32
MNFTRTCSSERKQLNKKGNIMAVPKRRTSKTRAAKRRTHYTVTLPVPVKDADGTWRMPHHINKTTGEYKS